MLLKKISRSPLVHDDNYTLGLGAGLNDGWIIELPLDGMYKYRDSTKKHTSLLKK